MPYTPTKQRFWAMVTKLTETECWLWKGYRDRNRYGQFNDGEKIVYAHVYSFLLADNILIQGNYVLHKCDKPACVNPTHLFQGTQKDNLQDCKIKGRNNRGAKNGQAKLKESEVKTIVNLLRTSTDSELGTLYKVSPATIKDIRKGITWKHIQR